MINRFLIVFVTAGILAAISPVVFAEEPVLMSDGVPVKFAEEPIMMPGGEIGIIFVGT